MPRKQKQRNVKSSDRNKNGTVASQPSSAPQNPTGKCRDVDGQGFPPHLLRDYGQHNPYRKNFAPADAVLLETLVPNAVYIARQALSSGECQEWINYAEEGSSSRWDEVSHPATKWIAHRECGRLQRNDWNMSHRLYQRIEKIVRQISPQLDIFDKASLLSNEAKFNAMTESDNRLPRYQPVSCNPNLRLYKYTKGQWFGRHVDESNKVDFPGNNNNSAPLLSAGVAKETQTEVTVLFYLSSCRGGATRFHLPHNGRSNKGKRKNGNGSSSSAVAFTPEEGAVLLHVHGDRCLEHEAEPVLEGVKYVLRTDIVYGIL